MANHPQLLSLLQDAKENPPSDGSRLVLADWLEDHGEPERAEFIRLQCHLVRAPKSDDPEQPDPNAIECELLLNRYGGAWLGSLWRLWLSPLRWHRGLLAVKLPPRTKANAIPDMLPWIDTLLFKVTGRRSLQSAVTLLSQTQVNHVHLDLRMPMLETTLLGELHMLPESPSLRSLTFDWPLRMLRHLDCGESAQVIRAEPAVGEDFLDRLLRDCPLGRHLTHLGSTFAFNSEQARFIRSWGVEPVHATVPLWMHFLLPTCFTGRASPKV